ncbi:kinase-like domain-containing protein [Xylariaceae sp. FL1019]|nr:kinase-like domain-containing protein [Xylariaceae sp. FL1019]
MQRLKHKHIVEFIASYHIGPVYSLIFPWAQSGSLRDYWKGPAKDEFRSHDLILWAFEQMQGLASAMRAINNPNDKISDQENGRHGDLKPDNVLLFDGESAASRGILRITDAGLARFHLYYTNMRRQGTTTNGATIEYAPPEAGDPHKEQISRLFDMWSLGYIYLEFVTWLIGGYAEVQDFQRKRKRSIECDYSQFYTIKRDDFRDHPEVKAHISLLRKDNRFQKRTCFSELLDIIQNDLLVIDIDGRMESSKLDEKLSRIVHRLRGNGFVRSSFSPRRLGGNI